MTVPACHVVMTDYGLVPLDHPDLVKIVEQVKRRKNGSLDMRFKVSREMYRLNIAIQAAAKANWDASPDSWPSMVQRIQDDALIGIG